ncbi:hypothetical protein GALL_121200 [mine drainage metagenome]|uniref:DUF3185 domain-containing protein n=1 Tax=mine drainage metagenome TaxID=410659 RepID=A0A1J5SNL6_9ZZZZ
MKKMGFVLIVLGIIMIIEKGFNYVTTEKVVDLGSIKISAEKNHPIQWSPILGAAILISGVVIVIVGKKGADKDLL